MAPYLTQADSFMFSFEKTAMRNKILSLVIFALVLSLILVYCQDMLFEKQHFGTAKNIANEDQNKIDVFFVGASHVFYGINPLIIWEKTGIAGYNLTTHRQPLWASRILLDYALEYQQPKLIVLDVIMATKFSNELVDSTEGNEMTHLALDPIPLSPQKVRSVLSEDRIINKNEMLFPFILNHTRLQQGLITEQDYEYFFQHPKALMKGYNFTMNILSYERPEVSNDIVEIPPSLETSFREFISFCEKKEIPLLLIKTPVVAEGTMYEEMYEQINQIGEIAKELHIPFIDFNHLYEEINLDFRLNFADRGHLNVGGADKVSSYLADYLSENYDLPDHRGDVNWESWDKGYNHYQILTSIPYTKTLDESSAVFDDPYSTSVFAASIESDAPCFSTNLRQKASAAGLKNFPDCSIDTTYIAIISNGKVILEEQNASLLKKNAGSLRNPISITAACNPGESESFASVSMGETNSILDESGAILMTIDSETETVIANSVFSQKSGYNKVEE